MSARQSKADPSEPIDERKQLIRLDADSQSLAERLSAQLARLGWRTPLHALRLRGRYPLKLLAVPDDPLPGDHARGAALLAGTMTWRGESRAIDALDLKALFGSRGFVEHVHSFAWLRDLAAAGPRVKGAPVAERLMAAWIAAHGERVDPVAWAPDLWGRRILNWTAHAPLILSSTDLVYRSSVLYALARGARHLERSANNAALGPRRVAAWGGIIVAGLLIPGSDARVEMGEAGLARALAASHYDDGGAVSRSPTMLLDTIALLAQLRAAYAVRRLELPEAVQAMLARMVPALLGVMHGDRALGSWQGSEPLAAEHVAAVIDATGIRTRPLRQARGWGYQRLAAGKAVLIVDAAPPPVAKLIDGGCASTLAFEFSDGPARIVVNCGGGRGALPSLPAALREGLRTTAAHSTLCLADTNSTAIHADGTLGRGVSEVELSRQESDAGSRIEAAHDGYVRRQGLRHRRQLMLAADGRELRGEDLLLPAGRVRRSARFDIRFHLGMGVQASATADGLAAILRVPGDGLWQLRCRGGALTVEGSLWIDGDGRPMATQQLVVSGDAAAGGAMVSWSLKRAR